MSRATYPVSARGPLLHERALELALVRGDRAAVVDGRESMSYAALRQRAFAAASQLAARGVCPGDCVALALDRSCNAIVAMFATLLVGAAYVPIDLRWPAARRERVLASLSARVVVVSDAWVGASVRQCCSSEAVSINDLLEPAAGGPREPAHALQPTDLAYVLFTSGSSGRPKGVMVSHRAAWHFVAWAIDRFRLGPDDRVAGVSSFAFDLSVFDVFATLSSGGTLYLYDTKWLAIAANLATFLERWAITVVYTVPTVLMLLEARGGLHRRQLDSLRLVSFAGEVFPFPAFERLRRLLPSSVRYHNLYGPTETNVCAAHELTGEESAETGIPIGRAIPGLRLHPVSSPKAQSMAPDAVELVAYGATLMSGYWGMADSDGPWLTDPESGERGYPTGDVCRLDQHGNWVFLGRVDAQLKINGIRIEASEVEDVLLSDPDVVQAVVIGSERGSGGYARMIAYVVPRAEPGSSATLGARLDARCRDLLPPGACPSEVRFVDHLPSTSTGKVDRRAVAESYLAAPAERVASEPQD